MCVVCVIERFCVYISLLEWQLLVLSLESWHKGSNTHFVRSLVLDEERMLVLFVSVSALAVVGGWQEGYPAGEDAISANRLLYQVEQEDLSGNV